MTTNTTQLGPEPSELRLKLERSVQLHFDVPLSPALWDPVPCSVVYDKMELGRDLAQEVEQGDRPVTGFSRGAPERDASP